MTAKQFLAWVTHGPTIAEVVTRTGPNNPSEYRDEEVTVVSKRFGDEDHEVGSGTGKQSMQSKTTITLTRYIFAHVV